MRCPSTPFSLCVCVVFSILAWQCYSRSPEKRPSPPLLSPFIIVMTITRGGEGGLAGRRWLAGSLVWTIQTNFVGGTEDGKNSDDNKTTHRDRLMKGRLLQCILRGWRPLIEASPPPPQYPRGPQRLVLPTYSPLYLVDTPVSQGADETGVPGARGLDKALSPSCLCRCRCRCRCTVRVVLAILRMQV